MWHPKLHRSRSAGKERSQLRGWCLVSGMYTVNMRLYLPTLLSDKPESQHSWIGQSHWLRNYFSTYFNLFGFSYTLLVGKPPFETSCLKDTYQRIKKNEYHIPSTKVSPTAKALIVKLLKADPSCRPSMDEVLHDQFFSSGGWNWARIIMALECWSL